MAHIVEVVVDRGLHQLLVVVHVVDGIAVFASIATCFGAGPDIRRSFLEVWAREGGHRRVEQGQHGGGVFEHLLTLGGGVEGLGIMQRGCSEYIPYPHLYGEPDHDPFLRSIRQTGGRSFLPRKGTNES